MDRHDEQDRHRQRIEHLLGYPGVGPLAADAIAVNLAMTPGSLDTALAALVKEGRIVPTGDSLFALPPERRT